MAHELELNEAGQAKMMYTEQGGLPWHGLGTSVDGVQTADDAIRAAQLDWTVDTQPVFAQTPEGTFRPIENRFRVRRVEDDRDLSVVSGDYKPIQNLEAFNFFDTLVDSGEAKYETAGSLAGGKRIWMSAKIGETMMVAGEDPHDMYLLLVNAHDGLKSLTAVTTMVRVVCANTETMAIRGAKTSWAMSHRSTLDGKVAEAQDALQLSFNYRDAFQQEVEKLLDIELSVDKFREVMKDVLPDQKLQQEKNLAVLTDLFESSPTIANTGHGGTAWGGYNAVTEFVSHGRGYRTDEARMINNVFGAGTKLRNKTHDALLALA